MTALYIILGIIAFFIIILCIPVFLELEYTDSVKCRVSWLFLKFNILPWVKKEKKEPEKKPEAEKPKEEKPVKEKEKKENFLKTFYDNQGVSGIIELIKNCANALGKFSKGFKNSLYIARLRIRISVTESDAATTAIKYGKICSELYPSLGFICSTMHVRNYKCNVYADYCGEKTKGEFETKIAVIPFIMINAGIALAFRLVIQLLKVVISNIKLASKDKNKNTKGGQEQ